MTSKLRYVAPSVLALAGIGLALGWDRIPQRWAIHWGISGRPNGFAHKTLPGVFAPLLIGLFVWGLHEVIATAIEHHGKIPELSRAMALPLRLVTLGVVSTFAGAAVVFPLLRPQRPLAFVIVLLLVTFGALAIGLMHVSREVARLKREGHHELHGWNGIVYRNPDDPRLLVPNVAGLGYTFNFAKSKAWWMLAFLLLLPALALLLPRLLR